GVLTVIDGAHVPAMVPLNLAELGCDFYGGNCHKWLLAPTGSGFLWLGPGSEERLQPLQVSWGWHHDRVRADERDEFGSTPRLRRRLWDEYRIEAPIIGRPEGHLIRVSTHFYNTEEEIDRLAEALPALLT